jgi:hypothetical protein
MSLYEPSILVIGSQHAIVLQRATPWPPLYQDTVAVGVEAFCEQIHLVQREGRREA